MSECRLHPLVVLNISDHVTRSAANPQASQGRAIGVLLGESIERSIELRNSFELPCFPDGSIDLAFLETRREQYKKTFPDFDFLGWYAAGPMCEETDVPIHQALSDAVEAPTDALFFLSLDVDGNVPAGASSSLPICVYTAQNVLTSDAPSLHFVRSEYQVDSIESERIAVEHVAQILPSGDAHASSAMAQSTGGQSTALSMLAERINVLSKYMAAVESGTIAPDRELLRQIKSICIALPMLDTDEYRMQSLHDQNNTKVVTLLASLTRATGIANEMIEKFNSTHDRGSRRRALF